jgi:hypothetical protein
VGAPGALLLGSRGSAPSAGAGCVTTNRAYIMGGADFTYCGADAVAACRRSATGDPGLAAQCERIGLTRRF